MSADPSQPALASVQVAGTVDRSPEAMAALERRALLSAPEAVPAIDALVDAFRRRLGEIDARLDATATLAELRRRSDPPLSPRGRIIRSIAGFLLLIVPVLALALLVVRRAVPLDTALVASAVLMVVAAVIALVMAILSVREVHLVRFGTNYLVGTAVVAALEAIAAVGLPAWNPRLAGESPGAPIAVNVVAAVVVVGSCLVIRQRSSSRARQVAAATSDLEPRVADIVEEVDRARSEALTALGALPTDAATAAALADRNAAVAALVKRYLLVAADGAALEAMPLGAFQLMPGYLAIVDGARR
ncbi:hypothetical protein WDJ51_06910 [Rathayibacter sp. YIM 133350]|uniref:hypothetical protein n=1 Tax=Rathayibacter sp. YIM 133350 TaxID=3131992 RepID=UPI00307DD0A3